MNTALHRGDAAELAIALQGPLQHLSHPLASEARGRVALQAELPFVRAFQMAEHAALSPREQQQYLLAIRRSVLIN